MSNNVFLDSVLLNLMNVSSDPRNIHSDTWEKLVKLAPNLTVEQLQRRYEQLLERPPEWLPETGSLYQHVQQKSMQNFSPNSIEPNIRPPMKGSTNNERNNSPANIHSTRPNNKSRESRSTKSASHEASNKHADMLHANRNIVIHVCDEAKGVKQDFNCPRRLLVEEMRYFADYLASEQHQQQQAQQQRWEEVDISVHCDVQIFEWLMRYVKRNQPPPRLLAKQSHSAEEAEELAAALDEHQQHAYEELMRDLRPNNVISILISSEFLKMDSLVELCIEYCHDNMDAILATPCNMNCINDKLVMRIAQSFNDEDADNIVDRKDKFKGKIFMKKIEALFDSSVKQPAHLDQAWTLFRCVHCQRVLNEVSVRQGVPCTVDRLSIRHSRTEAHDCGQVTFQHEADPHWDVNDWLLSLAHVSSIRHHASNEIGATESTSEDSTSHSSSHTVTQQWRDVFWRLWGHLLIFTCSSCHSSFQACELHSCLYHPQQCKDYTDKAELEYPCCKEKVGKFQTFSLPEGCEIRDHEIVLPNDSTKYQVKNLLDCLQARRSVICLPDAILRKRALKEVTSGNRVRIFRSSLFHDRTSNKPSFVDDTEEGTGPSGLPSGGGNEANSSVSSGPVLQPRLQPLLAPLVQPRQQRGAASLRQTMASPVARNSKVPTTSKKHVKGHRSQIASNVSGNGESDDMDEEGTDEGDFEDTTEASREEPRQRATRTIHQEAILVDVPQFGTRKSKKWDVNKSLRANQDSQRQEDLRRMQQMVEYLVHLRGNIAKTDKFKQKEYPGGLFSKLEHQWKMQRSPPVAKVAPLPSTRLKSKGAGPLTPFR